MRPGMLCRRIINGSPGWWLSAVLVETLEGLDLSYPKVDGAKRQELAAAKKLLVKK